jgi:stage III sporulation protein SpoIIIAA
MTIPTIAEQEILEQARQDLHSLLTILPADICDPIKASGRESELLEVVMDLGRRPAARFVDGELILRETETTREELTTVVSRLGAFDDDNRAGLARTLHRISAIRNRRGDIVGLTCRVGRAVYSTIDIIADIVEDGRSILLVGRPGVGKTTMLREMARVLAQNKRVIIVDTSNEIGGDGDIAHPAVGRARRMQVPRPSYQHETMIEAVENHNPEVIIIDEIGREQEALAARTINERGVQLVGTAHGNTLENLLLNPTLSDLVGGIESVTLSDEEARRRGTQKTVLERRAPPTFDVLIEIQDRQRLAIHQDVSVAVDSMLRGRSLGVELRYRDEDGQMHVELEQGRASSPVLSGRAGAAPGQQPERVERGPRNGAQQNNVRGSRIAQQPAGGNGRDKTSRKRIFPYGVARNRLTQAARQLGVSVEVVSDASEADVLFTLKSYYRRRQRVILDAEQRRIPIFVLRANTVNQMQNALAEVFGLEATYRDPFELALHEAEEAIARIHAGEPSVDLSPADAHIRRYQHQLARQADLVSHSYGQEPNRHVRIYDGRRN